jgi:hypothetical protein
MNKHAVVLTQSLFLAALFAASSFASAQDDALKKEEALKKDLTSVIALQGLPCGQVVTVKTQAENDFAVTCKDDNKYRVYLNAAGRVLVEKRK